MFKIILFLIISLNSWALTKSQMMSVAKLHAQHQLTVFDLELDQIVAGNKKIELYDIPSYAQLVASRIYLEQIHAHDFSKELPVMISGTPEERKVVIQKINTIAQTVYPSITNEGNVTGNTFPRDVWSLTFDDGPRAGSTLEVLANLQSYDMKATFFMLTREAKKYVTVAKKLKAAEMEIALHSYTHPQLTKVSAEQLDYEITQAKYDLEDLLEVDVKLFRLPYGAGVHVSRVRQKIADNNLVHIFWNVDTLDWQDKNPESVLARVKKQMQISPKGSGVILFHDIHKASVASSQLVMQYLFEQKMHVCTVGEVIDYLNGANTCL